MYTPDKVLSNIGGAVMLLSESENRCLELIKCLKKLTKQEKLHWQDKSSPFSTHRYETEYKGTRFTTEWLRGDKPILFIDGLTAINSYSVVELILFVYKYTSQSKESVIAHVAVSDSSREKLVRDALKKLKK